MGQERVMMPYEETYRRVKLLRCAGMETGNDRRVYGGPENDAGELGTGAAIANACRVVFCGVVQEPDFFVFHDRMENAV